MTTLYILPSGRCLQALRERRRVLVRVVREERVMSRRWPVKRCVAAGVALAVVILGGLIG